MKLFVSPTSPYVRKVLIAAIELGLADKLQLVTVNTLPTKQDPVIIAINPLGKIPALQIDDGTVLYDSRVILEYLNTVGKGTLIPTGGNAHWRALRLQALSDGLLDAAVAARYETALRPAPLQWQQWVDAQTGKIVAALDALQREALYESGITVAEISAYAALDYLDFRFDHLDWRSGRTALADFFEAFSKRKSVQSLPTRAA
ncbi:glutathione S-transferase [Gimibacter soli]|uniref:Glutathione S-transferase n=1 Tax=Gimibacter soli TaxID=3024400 RepID=A0AAE9XNB9_9PROT|nr:glutathione S-transferase [Gimibacter soli]WCL53704.1 glutathione S-transferase [Gimibacter soli]